MAIENITADDKPEYLRYSVALDKRAILKDKPAIPGLDYEDAEQLVIIPITSGDRVAVQL